MKINNFLIVILVIILSTACNSSPLKLKFENLELADNNEEREKGLMFRQSLCKNCAMLFQLDQPAQVSFWMKNTYIPLDIIFIKENGQISDIYENVEILREDLFYTSSLPIKYVLEVNAGYAKKHNLNKDLILDLNYLYKEIKN